MQIVYTILAMRCATLIILFVFILFMFGRKHIICFACLRSFFTTFVYLTVY